MDNNGQNVPLFEVDYIEDLEHVVKNFKYPASKLFRLHNILRYIAVPVYSIRGLIIVFSNFIFHLNQPFFVFFGIWLLICAALEFLNLPEIIARRVIKKETNTLNLTNN